MAIIDGVLGRWLGINRRGDLEGLNKEVDQVASKLSDELSIASSGTDIYGGYLEEEYLGVLQNEHRRGEIYDEMHRSDGTIAMCLRAKEGQLLAAKWGFKIKEEFSDDPLAQDQLDFMAKAFPTNELYEFVRLIGKEDKYGFSLFELYFRPFEYEGVMMLRPRTKYMLPKSIRQWIIKQDTGVLHSVRQEAYGDDGNNLYIPADRLIHSSIDGEGLNYEGISLLRQCYGPYNRKITCFKKLAIGNDTLTLPFLKIYNEANGILSQRDLSQFETKLSNRSERAISHMVFPKGFTAEEEITNFDPEKLHKAIAYENDVIVKNFLLNFLMLGTGAGSFALSKDLSDFFLKGLENQAKKYNYIITEKILNKTIELNFNDECMIEAYHSSIGESLSTELGGVIKEFVNSDVIQPDEPLEEFLRNKLELPPKDVETIREKDTGGFGQFSKGDYASRKGVASQARRASKRIKKLRTGLVSNYTSYIEEVFDKKIQKILSLTKGKDVNEVLKLKKKELKTSLPSLDVKTAIHDSIEVEIEDYLKSLGSKYNKNKPISKSTLKSFFASYVSVDIDDIVSKVDDALYFAMLNDYLKGSKGDRVVLTSILGEEKTKATLNLATNKASTIASKSVTESRRVVEEMMADQIESYTYYNPDPQAEICVYLNGKTLSPKDAALYIFPLHYNCASTRFVNLKSFKDNPNIQTIAPTKKAVESIQNV